MNRNQATSNGNQSNDPSGADGTNSELPLSSTPRINSNNNNTTTAAAAGNNRKTAKTYLAAASTPPAKSAEGKKVTFGAGMGQQGDNNNNKAPALLSQSAFPPLSPSPSKPKQGTPHSSIKSNKGNNSNKSKRPPVRSNKVSRPPLNKKNNNRIQGSSRSSNAAGGAPHKHGQQTGSGGNGALKHGPSVQSGRAPETQPAGRRQKQINGNGNSSNKGLPLPLPHLPATQKSLPSLNNNSNNQNSHIHGIATETQRALGMDVGSRGQEQSVLVSQPAARVAITTGGTDTVGMGRVQEHTARPHSQGTIHPLEMDVDASPTTTTPIEPHTARKSVVGSRGRQESIASVERSSWTTTAAVAATTTTNLPASATARTESGNNSSRMRLRDRVVMPTSIDDVDGFRRLARKIKMETDSLIDNLPGRRRLKRLFKIKEEQNKLMKSILSHPDGPFVAACQFFGIPEDSSHQDLGRLIDEMALGLGLEEEEEEEER